jgi:hypothetical protein
MEIDANGDLKINEVAAAGVIKDKYGNEWAIPTDELSSDELFTNPLKLPKQDPLFFYEFVRADQVQGKATEGFVLVEREEVGVETPVTNADIGLGEGSHHQVHDLHLMKIPRVLADRRYRAMARVCKEATDQITDPARLAQAGRQSRTLTGSPEPFEAEVTSHSTDFSEPTK